MNKELDWSKAQPNKFAGKPLAIVGDRQRRKLPPPAGKFLFRFTFVNGTQMEVPADTEKAAREWVLGYFGWVEVATDRPAPGATFGAGAASRGWPKHLELLP